MIGNNILEVQTKDQIRRLHRHHIKLGFNNGYKQIDKPKCNIIGGKVQNSSTTTRRKCPCEGNTGIKIKYKS